MIILARATALISLSSLLLAACEEGQGPSFGLNTKPKGEETATEAGADPAPKTVLKDVERPDIFNVTESALWDGRPSLGGVWVAHPDITTPERVILTNTKTGKSIPGALFRRERNNPGPRIQVSSEAAAGLGMIAGQPVDLKVLVVRQEEVVIEAAPAPEPEAEADPEKQPVSGEDLAAAGIGTAATEAESQAEPAEKKPNFFQRLFGRKPATATAAGTATAATVEDASAPEVETATLAPARKAAAPTKSTAKPNPRPARRTPAPAPAPAVQKAALKNPYIQVGQFSVEANADATATNLRQSGIVPTILQSGDAWRVLIGPVSTADDQAALLAQVKKLGYADAFLAPK
ncbi:MAG: SPOR domain-containing protein [Silicimonas sp.]|nr:SPOR domain-containing protein [Silicimonas sp.]